MTVDPNEPTPTTPAGEHAHAHGEEEMVCYCFHVPLHKIVNFIRRERPAKVSMISHCLGAGTGCGTCVWDIKDIWQRVMAECAAEDAQKGVVRAPTQPSPSPPPLPPTGLASDYFRRHSPSVDLGEILPPTVVPNPDLGFVVPASAPPPTVTPTTYAAPPPMPVGPESADIDYDVELEPEPGDDSSASNSSVTPATPAAPPAADEDSTP